MSKSGFTKLPNEIVESLSFRTAYEKYALIILLSYTRPNRPTAFPTLSSFAERMLVSVATARRALAGLAELGYITIEQRTNKNGNQSNLYTVLFDRLGVANSNDGVANSNEGGLPIARGGLADSKTEEDVFKQIKEKEEEREKEPFPEKQEMGNKEKHLSLKDKDQDQVQVPEHLVEYVKAYTSPLTNNLPAYQVTPQDLAIFQHLHEQGITPNQLAGFIRRTLQLDWWANPSVGLRYISQNITGDRRSYAH